MKNIIYLSTIVFFIFCSCNNKENKNSSTSDNSNTASTGVYLTEEEAFSNFIEMYNELLNFKNNNDFKKLGFGNGSPYKYWIEKLHGIEKSHYDRFLKKKSIVFDDLESLGNEYVKTKGSENDATNYYNDLFSNLSQKSDINGTEHQIINNDYESIKKKYKLIGKWGISIAHGNIPGYDFEIYNNKGEFIGVRIGKEITFEKLKKIGNDYYIIDNKSGEFYRITENSNLKLFDKKGDLSNVGYRTIKK